MPYGELATRRVLGWMFITIAARAPVAMTPLALVFLVRERPGGYSVGAMLAAAYVLGEVVGAAVLGARLSPQQARRAIVYGLAVGAAAFAGLALAHGTGAHLAVVAGCAFVAGGAPAAAPGGLRAMLTTLVPERAVPQALSAETILTYGIWAVAPVVATALALSVNPLVPLLVAAALAALAALGLLALPQGRTAADSHRPDGVSMLRTLAMAWPVYTTAAAALSLFAVAELVLPALLEQRGIALQWTGWLMAGYAVATAVGAFFYGLRKWPGGLRAQSLVLLLASSACVALAATFSALLWIALALLGAGVLQSGVQVARSLSLREVLPPHAVAAGFSMMYAAIGVGDGVATVLAGLVQKVASPSTALYTGVALTLVLTAIGALGDRRHAAPRPPVRSGPDPRAAHPAEATAEASKT